ncbi:ATP-dependent zinc metalloprotease FtsH [Streptomyces sp. YIM 130001]|nr:ATP-dependent zinc metalloprotease FtsH [Streptomyces sp. YIM 130001]
MPGGWRSLILTALTVFLLTNLALSLFGEDEPKTISYTEFSKQVTTGNVEKIYAKGDEIQGDLKKDAKLPGDGDSYDKFSTRRPSFADDKLWGELTEQNVVVTAEPVYKEPNLFTNLLISLAPLLLLVGLWIFISRRMASGMGGGAGGMLGRKTPPEPVELEAAQRTTFADVAGIDGVEGELSDVVDFLKSPDAYRSLGARMPGGVLLAGPRAPARLCSPERWPARPECRSSRPPPPSSSR